MGLRPLNLTRRSRPVSWDQFKNFFTRNWREKLVAVLLAFLFWFMIKGQISPAPRFEPPLPPLRAV